MLLNTSFVVLSYLLLSRYRRPASSTVWKQAEN